MINYYLLTKPGIILGNLMTLTAGFFLAAHGSFELLLFFQTLLGLGLVIASACVFNNYIDRNLDKQMERTKKRAFPSGIISIWKALLWACFLGVLGSCILLKYTNFLTFSVAFLGFFIYVVLYSLWKGHTIYATAIGSVAGAIPPVVGYCAVSNTLDIGALILFAMLVLWQMPHFFSIAILNYKDYALAKIPVLPVEKGFQTTKIHMVVYIIGFMVVSALLPFFGYTGLFYLLIVTSLSFVWLILCLQGFYAQNEQAWGKKMFHYSLLLVTAICLVIPLDKI